MVFCLKLRARPNPYLPANVLRFVEEKFEEIDADKQGAITAEEAADGLSKCGYNANLNMIEAILRMCDDDNNEKIDQREFVRIVICLSLAESRKAKIYMFFVAADKDLSGSVSKAEFKDICGKLGLGENEALLRQMLRGIKKDMSVEQYLLNIAKLEGRM